jgi:hypothetical protein
VSLFHDPATGADSPANPTELSRSHEKRELHAATAHPGLLVQFGPAANDELGGGENHSGETARPILARQWLGVVIQGEAAWRLPQPITW